MFLRTCGMLLVIALMAPTSEAMNFNKPQLSLPDLPSPITYSNFWTPPSRSTSESCQASIPDAFKKTKVARRTDSGTLINAAAYFGNLVTRSISTQSTEVRQSIKSEILDWAKSNYFSQPDMSTQWSPVYIQSNLIRLTAFYVSHMNQLNELSVQEKQTLALWIEPMLRYQKGKEKNGSDDSRAASGVALMAWGSVMEDQTLVKKGMEQWAEALPYLLDATDNLKRQVSHKGVPLKHLSLEDEYNLTMAHIVEGAVILENLGISDIFSAQLNDKKLIDAIEWWLPVIETPPPQFRGATRLNSHNWHVGWLPIFISNERSANTSALVQKILNQLTVNGARSFRAVSLGGATDCLWSWEATKINLPTDLPPQAKAFCSAALGQWKRGDSNGKWINKVTELGLDQVACERLMRQ
jgi:hypothetical protein